jgi:magnesium chelatase family protein
MIAKVYSVVVSWLDGQLVEVEVDIHNGMPAFIIVWLPDTAIQESRERVRSAIKNSDLPFPRTKITVNLAPADIKKTGPSFDLPIALWILLEECKIDQTILNETLVIGELALDGAVRAVQAVLPTVIFAKEKWYKRVIVPEENAIEAALIPWVEIVPAKNIAEIVRMLSGSLPIVVQSASSIADIESHNPHELVDFSQIVGQQYAKRAILIAAAGGHNILMEWPPWSGKTMLSKALWTILPPMVYEEIVEVSKIYSVAGKLSKEHPLITERPFRRIHHTASAISIIGWGRDSKPGEISLAHKWVLFLDEMLEFPQTVLETLRQPLEDGVISVNRVQSSCIYPARFMLVGAMNPCPCGFMGDPVKKCTCQPFQIERYRSRLSGPLLDRMDIFIHVPRVNVDEIATKSAPTTTSAEFREQVMHAREKQLLRLRETGKTSNAEMTNKDIDTFCVLDATTNELLQKAVQRLDLSTRAYYRTLKLARTIADLAGSDNIASEHITEALGYREKTK